MFNPSCWKYVTVGDLWSNLSAQDRENLESSNPMWLQLSPHTVFAKIVWSREACTLLHPQAHQQPPSVSHVMDLGNSYSMSRWGSDLSIIDIDDGLGDQFWEKQRLHQPRRRWEKRRLRHTRRAVEVWRTWSRTAIPTPPTSRRSERRRLRGAF